MIERAACLADPIEGNIRRRNSNTLLLLCLRLIEGRIKTAWLISALMQCIDVRLIISGYLIVQALGATVWWCVLFIEPESVKWFQPASWSKQVLYSFLLPDLCLLVAGSLVTADAILRRRSWCTLAIWSIAMANLYPTLFCIGVSLQTGEAWIASALMSTLAGLMLAMATIHGTNQQIPAAIRVTEMTPIVALSWTLLQILFFGASFCGFCRWGSMSCWDESDGVHSCIHGR